MRTTYVGTFKNIHNDEQYKVTIQLGSNVQNPPVKILDATEAPEIITDEKIYFSPDPVHIKCERSDLTQLIMITQCEIKLKVSEDMSGTFLASTNRDISVTVSRISPSIGSGILFFGYVDPLQFEQGFAHNIDEITLNCTDPLGALQDIKIDQNTGISETDVLKPIDLIKLICTRTIPEGRYLRTKLIFPDTIDPNKIKINAGIFYGDDKDDRMTLYDTLNEILRYIGCTLCYEPQRRCIDIYNIYQTNISYTTSTAWFDPVDDAMSDDASLSNDDVYSKVTLTCEIEPVDDTINLIDDSAMYSDYTTYQKYMTELVSPGEGQRALNGFIDLLKTETTTYDVGYKLDHYCYVKRNDQWSFGSNSYITYKGGKEKTDSAAAIAMTGDQTDVLTWLKENPGKAAFVSYGVGNKINYQDNSPVNNIPLTNYLVISVQGHNDHGQNGHIKTLENNMEVNSPVCSFTGIKSVNLTPTDPRVTNYLVISGKLILNPLQMKTGSVWNGHDTNWPGGDLPSNLYKTSTNTYQNAYAYMDQRTEGAYVSTNALWHHTVPHPDNGDGAYYTQKWWKLATGATPTDPDYVISNKEGIFGFLDNKENEMLKYSWSSYSGYSGDETDIVSKVPILACQLKVGDKYCVERLDLGKAGQGVFEWYTESEWKTQTNLWTKGFDRPYFTIGFDPKVDDKLVGRSYPIQNNIEYTMNVDASGTAIPIKISDKLNGIPEFTILGPINQEWNEIERIHPTLFRHTSWEDHKFWTLELLDSILVSDLKIEMKSDNAKINNKMTTADNDLVYASAINPRFTDTLECSTKICTPLTMQECIDKGVKYQQSNSYVLNLDNSPFYGWTSGNDTIKPEHLFIDYYYRQYNSVAKKLNFTVDNGWAFGTLLSDNESRLGFADIVSSYNMYMKYPGLKPSIVIDSASGSPVWSTVKNWYCMGMDWSLQYKENNMTMRQKFNYPAPL